MRDQLYINGEWVSPDLGGYLIPGLGRTFRVSAQLDF